jgi:hypothetical protein
MMATGKKTATTSRAKGPATTTSVPTVEKAPRMGSAKRSAHAAPKATVTQLPLFYSATHAATRTLARTPVRAEPAPHAEKSVTRGTTVRERFGELRDLLAEGWEIVQPIFARPLWSATDNSTTAFNFVLRRENATRLLTVPEGRTVHRFIRERNLLVDYRS